MAENAFNQLKRTMTSLPVLAFPNYFKLFRVEKGASSKGVVAMLLQGRRPVPCFGQQLSTPRAQEKYSYERELMAIMMAGQKWRHYLGQYFTSK